VELAGATVEVVERCSGYDGTWGAKTEFFNLSMGKEDKISAVLFVTFRPSQEFVRH
jgi:hypothetical protein